MWHSVLEVVSVIYVALDGYPRLQVTAGKSSASYIGVGMCLLPSQVSSLL